MSNSIMPSIHAGEVGEAARDLLRRHVGAAVVEPVDRDARVDLVGPVARALAHEQPARSGVELPPVAVVAGRAARR